jgi:hypothetical protein
MDPGSAQALNVQIRRLASMLPGGFEHEYGFGCECGCGEIVSMTADEYGAGGAWLAGHNPIRGRSLLGAEAEPHSFRG